MAKPIIYIGPTAYGSQVNLEAFDIRPPIKRGDIDRMLDNNEEVPDTLIIVDGTFHSYPSVGHRELLRLIDSKCKVWGICSMGAIRAAELEPYGMLGFGTIYQHYSTDPDFDDDEVTLIHGASKPYFPISEPMIHFRSAITHLVDAAILEQNVANRIIQFMKERWYGYRTLKLFSQALSSEGIAKYVISDLIESFDNHRLKRADFEEFVSQEVAFQEDMN